MGGNSSKTLQNIDQTIRTYSEVWGTQESYCTAIIQNVEIISRNCPITINNACLTEMEIQTENILDMVATAAATAQTQQNAAMFAFLANNSSNTEQAIRQNLETEISSSCEQIGVTEAIVQGLRIHATDCGDSGITVLNLGKIKSRCVLAQSANIITDADLASDTQQDTSLFGDSFGSDSSENGAMVLVLIVVAILTISAVLMILFFVMKRRKETEREYTSYSPLRTSKNSQRPRIRRK
jgi:hypothetical protein